MATKPGEELVEVYRAGSAVEADKIVTVVLNPEGIEASVLDRNDREFPGIGQSGGYFVAVDESQKERALQLIDEAVKNGVVTA